MSQMYYTYIDSPVGQLMVAGTQSTLKFINFATDKYPQTPEADWIEDNRYLQPVIQQIQDYFQGKRQTFELSLTPEGTPFQKKVWQALLEIPYGQTVSYGEIAKKIGNPKASRAVGTANGHNPIPIIIPCHRVIGSTGALTGFGGGLAIKEKLLILEQEGVSPQTSFSFAPG